MIEIIFLILVVAIYMLPTIIAYATDRKQKLAILLVNVLTGWFFGLGWIFALIWSVMKDKDEE